ncbi:hypothetical protein JEP98_18505 [Providencia rettgeri]|uniref:hypothetical protein n=1 Tax=Providencia rettgeri TaxID=587 RepID=UPI0018E49BDB|nr:hypothetical protein [Providencia rettgeri]MBI6191143.1 hypothetical protein [Providencia rettgeri]
MLRRLFYFILFCFHVPISYSAISSIAVGETGTFPIPTKIEWVRYDGTHSSQAKGRLGVTWTISNEVANYPVSINMGNGTYPVLVTMCPRAQLGFCAPEESTTMTCTPSDKGNFQTCLSRYIGTSFYNEFEMDQSGNATSFCVDVNVLPSGFYPSNNAFATRTTAAYSQICSVGGGGMIPEPPKTSSVCSLNSQDIVLTYSSTNLNVNGLTQSANLNVSCTEGGDPQDYQLKLTGTNVQNGNLNFTNGVFAQVSLNGTRVQANGSGIILNSLKSGTIPVSATLLGTASSSGFSRVSGVLILEAQ